MAFSPATWIGNQFGISDTAMAGAAIGGAVAGPTGAAVGFGLGSSVSSAQDALKAQEEANAANIAMTRETNATAIELANNAHQREVADLKAAGLNPILSAKYGGSAIPSLTAPSTESTSPTILSSAKQTNDVLSTGLSLGLQQKLQASQIQATSAQAAKTKAETDQLNMQNAVASKELPGKLNIAGKESQSSNWSLFLRDLGRGVDAINPFKGFLK